MINYTSFYTPVPFYQHINQAVENNSTITTALKVVNDISIALKKEQHCASLFIDLSKAFDTVDHDVLKLRLLNSGFSEQAVA